MKISYKTIIFTGKTANVNGLPEHNSYPVFGGTIRFAPECKQYPYMIDGCFVITETISVVSVNKNSDIINSILALGFLSTSEFCEKYDIPKPKLTEDAKSSAFEFITLDAIKYRILIEKVKLHKKNIQGGV